MALDTPIDSLDPTIPMDSLPLVGPTADWYLHWAVRSPQSLQGMLYSLNTGAFLRGLTKQFALPEETTPKLAFMVVRVAIGEVELAKLASVLSSELQLPNDKAQAIAREIEKELFVPYMRDWNAWLTKLKQEAEANRAKGSQGGVQNVIDLKNQGKKR